jgi:hypothetical protein
MAGHVQISLVGAHFHARQDTIALLTLLLPAGTALAEDTEPFALLELGAAGEWDLNVGSGFGPTVAIEFAAIKNWLAIEPGVTTLFSRWQTEWDTGFVFRKPFDVSPAIEFEPGIGPVWIHTVGDDRTTDSISVEASAHFEFWPTPDRLSAVATSNLSAWAPVCSFPLNS